MYMVGMGFLERNVEIGGGVGVNMVGHCISVAMCMRRYNNGKWGVSEVLREFMEPMTSMGLSQSSITQQG